tara:strand:- start:1389 stop:1625 length:237 start_codon:yes stop_codon:yes gene_type:complete
MLGWIPFFEPMNAMQSYWYVLLLPMSFGISIIYRALRHKSYASYWRSVFLMTTQIVLGIVAIAIAISLFVQFIVPNLN